MSTSGDIKRYFKVSAEAVAEIVRAREKHGGKDFNSSHEGFAILKEEVDELWDEVKKDDYEAAYTEAIQVAAMALRYAAEIDPYQKYKVKTGCFITENLIGGNSVTNIPNFNHVSTLTTEKSERTQ